MFGTDKAALVRECKFKVIIDQVVFLRVEIISVSYKKVLTLKCMKLATKVRGRIKNDKPKFL